MSRPETIIDDLQARLNRYYRRHGAKPRELPITLDEWYWYSQWRAYTEAYLRGRAPLLNVPTEFRGCLLRLVVSVTEHADGGISVKR